jgi:transcriptional regulator with XRE-family HTH domain
MTARRASDFVADRVRQLRQRRGLTAEGLAARCAEIGAPEITRSVIANIETGRMGPDGRRRRDVTVDELFILAFALEVPPALLAIPLDGADALQVADEVLMDPLQAANWMAGDDAAEGFYEPGAGQAERVARSVFAQPSPDATPLALLRRISAVLNRAQDIKRVNAGRPPEEVPLLNLGRELAQLNAWLTSLGFTPPPLPPDIAEVVERAAMTPGEGD